MAERLIILTEGASDPVHAKTACSVIRYRTDEVVAVLDGTQVGRTSGQLFGVGGDIPVIATLGEASAADTLLIGIAPSGGRIPQSWRPIVLEAISRGMNVVSGLHEFLGDDEEFARAAAASGVRIHDVRKNNERDVALREGFRPGCLRIQTIAGDCSLGKMVTAIEITRGLRRAGRDAKFVATGQTGIMIEGDGCPVDCVVADFVSGAAEKLVLANEHHEILLIEGQGSLAHPKYSAVTLGLLHGCMPQGLILCYEVGRKFIKDMDGIPLKSLAELRSLYETMAAVMQPARVIGIAMNGRLLTAEEAAVERARVGVELGLPVCDVFRDGPQPLVRAVLDFQEELLA